jgi:hypothetical protein
MLAATGSTTTTAVSWSSGGRALNGATTVSATAASGTPTDPDRPWLATPEPPAASNASLWPW